jgi:hypothetical protein
MSQAERPNTPIPSRRALLAGAPAVAAAALAAGGIANTLAIAGAAMPQDPIFAVIHEHRAHMKARADAMDAEDMADSDAEYEAALEAMNTASAAFEASIGKALTVQPMTIAGVAALLDHVGQEEFMGMSSGGSDEDYETILTTWLNRDDNDPRKRTAQDFPLRLAATVRAMAGTAAIRRIEQTEPDPILAVIERHRMAWEAFEDRCSDLDHEGTPEARAEWKRLHNPVKDAECELGEAKCSTLQGAIQLLRYVDSLDAEGQPWHRHFHRSFANALAKIEGVRS